MLHSAAPYGKHHTRVRMTAGGYRRSGETEYLLLPLGSFVSANVSAVYEPPEPTARAAQEVPRLSLPIPFMGCVAGARKRAVRNTQRVR